MTKAQMEAVADWHADVAMLAYAAGKMDNYCRHIAICDHLRAEAVSC